MTAAKNLRDTIIPKSDQLNADQLLTGPITIKITGVVRNTSADQPLTINYDGEAGRPYKPCKTMRRVLIKLWGDDGSQWIGRGITLFNDPEVKWAGAKVGGVRISHMTDIEGDTVQMSITETRGKKSPFTVRRLKMEVDGIESHKARLQIAAGNGTEAFKDAWKTTPAAMQKQLTDFKESLKEIAAKADAKPADDGNSVDAEADFE